MTADKTTHLTPLRRWLQKAVSGILMTAFGLAVSAGETNPVPENSLEIGGSIALADLVTEWADDFRQAHPDVEITVFDGGSETGIGALINGIENIVLVSLPLAPEQRSTFEDRYGYPPTVIPVAMDGVAIYVNRSNPLRRISLLQLDGIFSSSHRCAGSEQIQTWGQLGVPGLLRLRPIKAYGLSSSTGAYQLFRRLVLCKGDFKADFQAMAGPAALESAVASEPTALGFSSSVFAAPGIRPLAVAADNDAEALLPTRENIRRRRYPLSRTLAIAVNRVPGANLPHALTLFLDYLGSESGRRTTKKSGFVSISSPSTSP